MQIRIVPFLFALPTLWAQPRPGDNHCRLDIRDLRVAISQIPTISIPGIDSADILAVSIPGIPIAISGATSKLLIEHPGDCGIPMSTANLPNHTWKLDLPVGSHSAIAEEPGPMIRFIPDLPGAYTIHLVACPDVGAAHNPCQMKLITDFTPNNKPILETLVLPPTETTLTVEVKNGVQIPPLFRPADHPIANGLHATDPEHYGQARDLCTGKSGILFGNPEWFTTTTWTGPTPPYELVEGRIYNASIASQDFPFDHRSNDVVAKVDLDPPFQRLLIDDTPEDKGGLLPLGGLETEWEYVEFPEVFRPVAGNRMSAFGYHVVDCGHEIYTEIHPPIAVAVHRQSPILLPPVVAFDQNSTRQRPVGPNVVVPGILSDVFVSLYGGELLGDVERGTHQPRKVVKQMPNGVDVISYPDKVNQPTTEDVQFTFRVYLPPNPAFVIRQYGLTPNFQPAVYWKEYPHPSAKTFSAREGFALKLLDKSLDGPNPYLVFSMDLSGLATGDKVARRIEAAWVYPDLSGSNWGLQNISVRLNELTVTDTGDFTSGDWKLWVNMSGSLSPWTKLIDCRGCVEQKTYTPQSAGIWQPGALSPDGTLPGVVSRFQGAPFDQLQFTGYDDDLFYSDGIPIVSVPISSSPVANFDTGACDNCPSYQVRYSFSSVANPGSVSQEAKDYFKNLLVHPAIDRLIRPQSESELYSFGVRSTAREQIVSRKEEDADSTEMQALKPGNMGVTLQSNDAKAFAQQLRKRILKQYGGIPRAAERGKLVFRLQQIKPSIPPAIYQRYLCDLETGKPCPALP